MGAVSKHIDTPAEQRSNLTTGCFPVTAVETAHSCNIPGTNEAAHALLNVTPPARVLDLGCHQGKMSRELMQRGYKVTSCDLVPHPGTEDLPDFHLVDANGRLPFSAESFEAILCTEVIEHLENPTNLLRECDRMLVAGGILVLSTPNISNLISRLVFLATGEFPQFRELHFKEWHHISPVSANWIARTAERFHLTLDSTRSEESRLGWKRRLIFEIIRPFLFPVLKKQVGAVTADHTLILHFTKRPVVRPDPVDEAPDASRRLGKPSQKNSLST